MGESKEPARAPLERVRWKDRKFTLLYISLRNYN